MDRPGPRHVADLLPGHANGTLGAREEKMVREHLRGCPCCRAELASWEAVRGTAVQLSEALPPPPEGVMAGVWDRVEENPVGERGARARLSLAWQILLGQVPLVRREIWTASALTMALGTVVALLAADPARGGTVLALFAPVVAAVGVAFLYGPENDPSLEVALSTPTLPRVVLLARLALVYGYDLALVFAATAVLALMREGSGVWLLVSLWVGPMFFLSSLALFLSLLFNTTTAVIFALGLWTVRLVSMSQVEGVAAPMESLEAMWGANPVLLALAALLLAVTLVYLPRQERLAHG